MRIDCDRARRGFPDLLDGPADTALLAHLSVCSECARELRSFEAVAEAVSRLGGPVGDAADGAPDVPDPGEAYWERFLPSVKARIARGRAGGGAGRSGSHPFVARSTRAVMAAAAALVLMMAAGTAAFLLSGPVSPEAGSLEMASLRLQVALERAAALPAGAAGAIALPGDEFPAVDSAASTASPASTAESLPEIDPADLVEALDELCRPTREGYLWVEDDVAALLQGLTDSQAARLRAQLTAEPC